MAAIRQMENILQPKLKISSDTSGPWQKLKITSTWTKVTEEIKVVIQFTSSGHIITQVFSSGGRVVLQGSYFFDERDKYYL